MSCFWSYTKSFNYFTIKNDASFVLVILWAYICWGTLPLYPAWWNFYQEWMLIFFSNYVPASIKKRMWFLSSIFFKCIILTDLQMLNQSYIPERNLLWSWYIIIFFIFWILFACSLLNVFIFMFIRDASLLFSFPVVFLTEFDISVKTGFIKWVWRYSLLFYFFFWTV